MVVLALIAIATAGAVLGMRDSPEAALEREADRLVALLESARARSRASGLGIAWIATDQGFAFYQTTGHRAEGSAPGVMLEPQMPWLDPLLRALPGAPVWLGPEPIIQALAITLALDGRTLTLASDGLRPFAVAPKMTDDGAKDAAKP